MSWSQPKDILAQLESLWQRGTLLASILQEEALFPLRLALKTPSSSEISAQFDAVRTWLTTLKSMPQVRLEMREIKHRLYGTNLLPCAVWLDTREAATSLIGKNRETARFAQIITLTRTAQPQLLPWLAKKPLRALQLHAEWPQILAVVGWMATHPRPQVYLRQVDLPGIDSKFIEQHRSILAELFDLSLAPEALDDSANGQAGFEQRYGFLQKSELLRLRSLDPQLAIFPGALQQEVALTSANFAALKLPITRVFMTENEINYLAFPNVEKSIVIFGAGYGFRALQAALWLRQCELHYWGDIDTHGFAILDQLRSILPHTRSLLMDQACLLAHQTMWGKEDKPAKRALTRLSPPETIVFEGLCEDRWGDKLRLEQERIGFAWLSRALAALAEITSNKFGGE